MTDNENKYMTKEELSLNEKRAVKERSEYDNIIAAEERALEKQHGAIPYGRWGARRRKFMEENIFEFAETFPKTYNDMVEYFRAFDEECYKLYDSIVDPIRKSPEASTGNPIDRIKMLDQADRQADEIILHDLVYNELYNGFSPRQYTWEEFYEVMSKDVEVTESHVKHWRYLWETFDKKRKS